MEIQSIRCNTVLFTKDHPFLHASLLGSVRCWPPTGTEKKPGCAGPPPPSRGSECSQAEAVWGADSRLGFDDVLFILRVCEAQVHEAGGCHPGPARHLPDRGGGSPRAGPPEPVARSSAQTPGRPEALPVLRLACFGSWPVSFLSGVSRPYGLECA